MYSAQPTTFEELLRRAELTIEHRSRGYVDDAFVYAKWILSTGKKLHDEHQAMVANLTATQARCTELFEENRQLKRDAITATDRPYVVKPE